MMEFDVDVAPLLPADRAPRDEFADTPLVRVNQGPTASEQVAAIEEQRAQGGFPQRPREGFWGSMRGMVLGEGRQTRATKELPDIAEIGLDRFFGDSSLMNSAAVLSTYDPSEQVKILQSRYPDLQVASDEAGNVILSYQGKQALLNRPGFSAQDALRVAGTAAAFTPAARATQGAGIGYNAAKVGLQSTATQAGLEAQQATQGGDFSAGETLLAGATGAGSQALFQALVPLAQSLRGRVMPERITDGVRQQFKKYAVEMGFQPDEVSDDMIRQVLSRSQGGTPEERIGQALESEFDVPLTRGQRSLDQPQLRTEDEMTQGIRGAGAERRMRAFGDEQREAVERAGARLESELTLGADPARAPSMVREGVRSAEEMASEGVNAAYDLGRTAELSPDGFRGMLVNMRRLVRQDESFDAALPETAKVLSEIQNTLKTMRKAPEVGARLKPLTLKRLEQYRRRLNTAIESASANPADKRQVTQIKRAWDDYLDRAVEQKLFSGDPEDLADLSKAREVFAEYAKKFRQNPVRGKSGRVVDQDPAGRFIERMIDANPTDEEILNAVFGASSISKKDGVAMWRKFSSILADTDPEAMMALKGAALRRLIKTTNVNGTPQLSGSKTITEIQKAMEKSGSLMREIFTKDELDKIRRFAATVKRTQPDIDRGRSNPAGSGMTLVRQFLRIMGMGNMEPALVVTEVGAGSARAGAGSAQAGRVIRPFSKLQGAPRGSVAGAQAATASSRDRQMDMAGQATEYVRNMLRQGQ